MSVRSWLTGGGRVVSIAYFGITALYCLLYFIPFTYVQLIEAEIVPALVVFARVHAWLFLPIAVLMDVGSRSADPPGMTRVLRLGFRITMGVAGVALLFFPLLPNLENNLTSYVWSQVALVPLLWVGCIDLTATRGRVLWSMGSAAGEGRVLVAALGAALFSWVVSTAVMLARPGVTSGLSPVELGLVWVWNLAAHLVLFLGVATLLLLCRGIAVLARRPAAIEMFVLATSMTLLLSVVIGRGIFAALAFNGGLASVAAITLAVTLVVSVWAAAVSAAGGDNGEPIQDGFAVGLRPLAPLPKASPIIGAVWLAGLGGAAWLANVSLVAFDWNYLMQRLVVISLWITAFAACYGLARPRRHHLRGVAVSVMVPLFALGVFRGVGPVSGAVVRTPDGRSSIGEIVERYSGFDVSAGLLADVLNPRPVSTEDDVELFKYLQAYTGIPRSVTLTPREVSFVEDVSQPVETPPNIFVIVVDSLRRDYLGAYDSQVTFTPKIDQFASDSLVFERAFSRYGATGLSEPSIWIGGMLAHKQYVSPFAPMNALQTMLRAQRYDAYISIDPILDKILEPEGWVTELDQGLQAGEVELCRSLGELQRRLSARADLSTPVYAFTQPQDIHIATITRGGGASIDDASYGDYYAPYASRLRRLDGCFGSFIDYLEFEGLYDNSIVILTSDHGDSLGEGGRFGHAYTIFPEILRIPLLMHVPTRLTEGLGVDEAGLAFSTDITPTLYALLGFAPEGDVPGSGRPLLTHRADERLDYVTADHLVASSYGPVYGLLSNGGDSLYILDAVNYRDYLYDLSTESNTASSRIGDAQRRSSRETIRRLLMDLNAWYGVPQLD